MFWTGDNHDHDIYYFKPDAVKEHNLTLSELFKEYFSDKGVPIYGAVGNHDLTLASVYNFREPYWSTRVLEMADVWSNWMTPEATERFRKWGYFSMPLNLAKGKKAPKNARVISLNTNAYELVNFYTWGTRVDHSEQMAWFEN